MRKPISKKARFMRDRIVANAEWGDAHEPQIHYTQDQRRDDALKLPPRHLPLWTDCSGFATLCVKWAGGEDPSGWDYNAMGYTGSIVAHAQKTHNLVKKLDARRGDIVILGPGTGDHAVVLLQSPGRILHRNPKVGHLGRKAEVASHGSEQGPRKLTLGEELAYFGGIARYCKTVPDDL